MSETRTARDLLELLDAVGFEWRYATTQLNMSQSYYDHEDISTTLTIEIPVGRIRADKIHALQVALASLPTTPRGGAA